MGLRFVSLFSGAGGLDLGLEQAGLTCAVCVENDKHAAATLRANGRTVLERDIRSVTAADLGSPDVLVGGPPCQDFSNAGPKTGLNGTRGSLVFEFARWVNELQPRFFLFENVEGLKGRGLDAVLDAFHEAGYVTAYGMLDAVDFGAAQHRRRLIIIGSCDPAIKPWLPSPTHSGSHPDPAYRWKTFAEATASITHHTFKPYSTKMRAIMLQVPEGGDWRSLPPGTFPGFEASDGGKTGAYRRLSRNEPAPTLVASGPVQQTTVLGHPTEDRPLSVEEYARLQGFPDDYKFVDRRDRRYEAIGNAVAVPMAKALGMTLLALARGEQPVTSKRTKALQRTAKPTKQPALELPRLPSGAPPSVAAGQRLKAAMRARGMTLDHLSAATGISVRTCCTLQQGDGNVANYSRCCIAVGIPTALALGQPSGRHLYNADWAWSAQTLAAEARRIAAFTTPEVVLSTPQTHWRPCWRLRGRIDLDPFSPETGPTVECGTFYNRWQNVFLRRGPPCARTPLTPSHTPSRTTRCKGDERAG